MHSNIKLAGQKLRGKIRRIDKGRVLYTAFLIPTALAMTPLQAHAAGETIWSKASEIMQDVYTQILGISTIAAIVTASIALLLMNFSKSGRTVDESRAWLKRIIITWAILNGLGFIMAYDLIPVSEKALSLINDTCFELPDGVRRLLVMRSINDAVKIERRMKNDFVIVVGEDGVTGSYEL